MLYNIFVVEGVGDMIYAVDFDGTLCVEKYPGIGEPRQNVIDFCKQKEGRRPQTYPLDLQVRRIFGASYQMVWKNRD